MKIVGGKTQVRKFSDVISEQESQLGKDKEKGGQRSHLGLNLAEQVMSGYY
jgi:hypothetical protein